MGSLVTFPCEEAEGIDLIDVIAVTSTVEVEDGDCEVCEVCEGIITRLDTVVGKTGTEYALAGRGMLDARDESKITHVVDGVDVLAVDLTSEVTGRT